ncbi:adenylyltransferase/cytidyltransferase family protein [Tenuifilum thalassicum]|uniref:Adenylyltransferase/cytidyltransferase family protein n=1 Tax=Tenuifilum thalassicum TaxID=2590900 RepID=A0A7D4CF91_9BACT|nr:adenylyltransferase/cytidyltransferase family protein [Tenuifilum thalassicum]QKG78846.1 adenylyltransferase/cytidyltransferase family protein [Tenuifilum thalassicum]
MDKKDILSGKVLEGIEFERKLAFWRFKDSSLVALYGTFDVFHPSVFDLITYAAEQGHELIVGVKSDSDVKKEKGEKFPIFNQEQRAAMVSAHQLVSAVYICEDGPEEFIKKVKPEVAVCCSHASDTDKKALEIAREWGAKVDIYEGSTTSIDDIASKIK